VIFQDFVRFDMRFDENIGVGEIGRVRGYLDHVEGDGVEPSVPAELVDAAEQSLAASLLPRFVGGYHQMLGRRFEGGVALSGGEWQKIALARAYLREAQLLILDEPTAALDARAEYEVFLRFSELVAGRMAVLISHRFSTVRMADRILVLQKGGIAEQGQHDQLVKDGGLYAEMYELQAASYR
jgi:ATP-binding cassette subfamily B protein